MTPLDQAFSPVYVQKTSKSPSYGPHRSIGLAAVLPLATVLFWSFGMGSTLLVWLITRRIPPVPGVSTGVFDGYLVVDEGNKTGSTQMLDGQESIESTMRGVLLITAISHFSSIAVVPLLGLGAFYVAAQWLDNRVIGPTPLQFGLVMQMCSMGTCDSILATSKYLFQHWNTGSSTRVSPIMYRALIISAVVVFLHYSLKVTDLWLTAEIGSVYYSRVSEVDITTSPDASLLGTRHNASIDPTSFGQSFFSTMSTWILRPSDDRFNPESPSSYYYQSLDTMNGLSTKNHIVVVNQSNSSSAEDTSYMAAIVRPPSSISSQWSWTASTIGMTTRCQPAPCDSGGNTEVQCPQPSNVYRSMPVPNFPYMTPPRSARTNNVTAYNPKHGEILSNLFNWTTRQPPIQTNPSYVVIQLHLDRSSGPRRDPSELGRIRLEDGDSSFYLGTCEITLYDIEISFTGSPLSNNNGNKDTNSQYRLTSPPVLMSENRTTLLLSPILSKYDALSDIILNDWVTQRLANSVLTDTVSPGFSDRVSSEFARLSLGVISSMSETIPAIRVADNTANLFSRYPMPGTLSYIVVVYAHGLLAIVLFVGIVGRSSRSVVVDDPGWSVDWSGYPVQERKQSAQELLLIHLRLTDPLAIVAEHFSKIDSDNKVYFQTSERTWPDTSTLSSALSTRTDPVSMFGVEGPDTIRVEVGLSNDGEGRRWFGLNHKTGRPVESPNNEKESFFPRTGAN